MAAHDYIVSIYYKGERLTSIKVEANTQGEAKSFVRGGLEIRVANV